MLLRSLTDCVRAVHPRSRPSGTWRGMQRRLHGAHSASFSGQEAAPPGPRPAQPSVPSSATPLPDILASLQSGIDFERARGFVNAQGRRRVFSDFLHDSLLQLAARVEQESPRRRLRAALAPARRYGDLNEGMRRLALQELVEVLQEVARPPATSAASDSAAPAPAGSEAAVPVPLAAEPRHPSPETRAPNDARPRPGATDVAPAAQSQHWHPADAGRGEYTDTAGFMLDLETTGVSVYKDCVAEIALLCLRTGRQLSTLVRLPAGTNMSRQAEAVNNLSNAMLSAPGVPTFEEAYAQVVEFIQVQTAALGPGAIPLICGHRVADFDLLLLANQARRSGLAPLERILILDTLKLANVLRPPKLDNLKLGTLYTHFTGKAPENAHRAMQDVLANRDVLQGLLQYADAWQGSFARLHDLPLSLAREVLTWPAAASDSQPKRSRRPGGAAPSTPAAPARQGLQAFGGGGAAQCSLLGGDPSVQAPGRPDTDLASALDGVRRAQSGEGNLGVASTPPPMAGMDLWRAALASADAAPCFLDTPLAGIRAPHKFTPRQLMALEQAGLHTLRDLVECYPRDFTVCEFGRLPEPGVDGEQPICLPARLVSVTHKPLRSAAVLEAVYEPDLDLCGPAAAALTEGGDPARQPRILLQKWRGGPAARFLYHELRELRGLVGQGAVLVGVVQPSGSWKAGKRDEWSLTEQGHQVLAGGEESVAELRMRGGLVQATYSARGSLKSNAMAAAAAKALKTLEAAEAKWEDPLPEGVRGSQGPGSLPYLEALKGIHCPRSEADIAAARERLAFQELFMLQLNLLLQRSLLREAAYDPQGALLAVATQDHDLVALAQRALPYRLTAGQCAALAQIQAEMGEGRGRPMASLLQGDVGCGKTIVAFLAALGVAGAGYQVALMAPTEVLAEQHARGLAALLARVNRRASEEGLTGLALPGLALVTGSARRGDRARAAAGLADGSVALAVGTHALLSEGTAFARLGLVVIDEQHRFGVAQRGRLAGKARPPPHVLSMSATPIPRSLALLMHGDLSHVVIREQPPGRGPVATRVLDSRDEAARRQVYQHILEEVEAGGQAYIICPLVEESAAPGFDDLRAVTEEHARLTREGVLPGHLCGLLHGRMTGEEKEAALSAFSSGRVPVLLSTTVVEVGVDVPAASVMVVEAAERFGLAQLHQLRGRVGRGARPATCYLLASTAAARAKLAVLASARDGFEVAELDFQARGAGDLLGRRQSGQSRVLGSSLKACSLPRDAALLEQARAAAATFLHANPNPLDWPPDLLGPVLRHQFLDLDLHEMPSSSLGGAAGGGAAD
ncbi:hypothetical protein ACKKBF_B30835 [Auxenochlorella protothecoides x Auxenochlorella symbiontica]